MLQKNLVGLEAEKLPVLEEGTRCQEIQIEMQLLRKQPMMVHARTPAPSKFLLKRILTPALHFAALSSLFGLPVFYLAPCSKHHTQAQRLIRPRLVLSSPSGPTGTIWAQKHSALAGGMFDG